MIECNIPWTYEPNNILDVFFFCLSVNNLIHINSPIFWNKINTIHDEMKTGTNVGSVIEWLNISVNVGAEFIAIAVIIKVDCLEI